MTGVKPRKRVAKRKTITFRPTEFVVKLIASEMAKVPGLDATEIINTALALHATEAAIELAQEEVLEAQRRLERLRASVAGKTLVEPGRLQDSMNEAARPPADSGREQGTAEQ